MGGFSVTLNSNITFRPSQVRYTLLTSQKSSYIHKLVRELIFNQETSRITLGRISSVKLKIKLRAEREEFKSLLKSTDFSYYGSFVVTAIINSHSIIGTMFSTKVNVKISEEKPDSVPVISFEQISTTKVLKDTVVLK